MSTEQPAPNFLELLDWRRRTGELYVDLRRRQPTADTTSWFRLEKDVLYRDHPRSPLTPQMRASFRGLPYWDFDPAARVEGRFNALDEIEMDLAMSAGETIALLQIGQVEFTLGKDAHKLDVFWVNEYSGGLFIPFRDATSGKETYGGGRYLLDTAKSADLGSDSRSCVITLDFNYAFHPSCAFDDQWACPLAPPQNVLPLPIQAGEQLLK